MLYLNFIHEASLELADGDRKRVLRPDLINSKTTMMQLTREVVQLSLISLTMSCNSLNLIPGWLLTILPTCIQKISISVFWTLFSFFGQFFKAYSKQKVKVTKNYLETKNSCTYSTSILNLLRSNHRAHHQNYSWVALHWELLFLTPE